MRTRRDGRKAVALRYVWDLPAPFIVASGRGGTAERIREVAASCGIPVVADPALADTLIDMDPGSFIPEDVYDAVAAILAFVVALEVDDVKESSGNRRRGADGETHR